MGSANDKHQAPTNRLKLNVRAVIKSEAKSVCGGQYFCFILIYRQLKNMEGSGSVGRASDRGSEGWSFNKLFVDFEEVGVRIFPPLPS